MEALCSTAGCTPTVGCPAGEVPGADALGGSAAAAPAEKIHDHPCYSEAAHHRYARLHVPVAPACNLRCNYCNRKYDCTNESRPGVVSEVLEPEEAVRKALAVATAIPELTVVGIAGPGDALANPGRTFATLARLRELAPDLRLCLSTNGLELPQHVEALVANGVEHVTVTVNAVDPEIGARIHPWVRPLGQRRRRGVLGAARLLENQLAGIEALAARGVLVKVNSVAIPEVNHHHLMEVARTVRARGACLHNIMPLIANPEHGTPFGLAGHREPTPAEMLGLRAACAGDLPEMSHCQQCRADAVGRLGEDQREAFTREKIEALGLSTEALAERREAARRAYWQQETVGAPAADEALASGGAP